MNNPTRYEHIYGIQLLDDLHNLFPEVLYDDRLLASSILVPFAQRRVSTLFPQEYTQKRTHYRLFQQERRRTEMAQEIDDAYHGIPPPPPIPEAPTVPTPIRSSRIPSPPPRIVRRTGRTSVRVPLAPVGGIGDVFDFGLGSSLGGGLETLLGTFGGLGGLVGVNGAFHRHQNTDNLSPVPIVPTPEQIRDATLVTSIEPARDVVCAICQDHAPPQDASADWRIIRHCNHRFHKDCIDRWFEQKTFCPVCRHDIRDHGDESPADAMD